LALVAKPADGGAERVARGLSLGGEPLRFRRVRVELLRVGERGVTRRRDRERRERRLLDGSIGECARDLLHRELEGRRMVREQAKGGVARVHAGDAQTGLLEKVAVELGGERTL